MLCESCHQRVADHHITDIINGGVTQKRDLCPECFLASSPDAPPVARRFATALRDARCEYCGGQPCTGSTDLLAMVTGVQLKFMCITCSIEHNRYLQEHLQEGASALSQQEQLNEEAEQHMKAWVSQRVSR
jgi:protein-arginine kinase activator protein McsA